jgi:hypothetical protein
VKTAFLTLIFGSEVVLRGYDGRLIFGSEIVLRGYNGRSVDRCEDGLPNVDIWVRDCPAWIRW